MGHLHVNSGFIQGFEIQLTTNENNHPMVTVQIDCDNQIFKFWIASDDRHPNLEQIVKKLKTSLELAEKSEADFQITEYAERHYLFITYPDGTHGQYTGARIPTSQN